MKKIIIKGCEDCPAVDRSGWGGHTCNLEEKDNLVPGTIIPEDKRYIPITPDWCPLKKQPILLKFKSK